MARKGKEPYGVYHNTIGGYDVLPVSVGSKTDKKILVVIEACDSNKLPESQMLHLLASSISKEDLLCITYMLATHWNDEVPVDVE